MVNILGVFKSIQPLNLHKICVSLVKEECVSEDEEEVKDTLVEEILQQGDTAIIYPEAPEDEQSPAETGGADENGDLNAESHRCLASVST